MAPETAEVPAEGPADPPLLQQDSRGPSSLELEQARQKLRTTPSSGRNSGVLQDGEQRGTTFQQRE